MHKMMKIAAATALAGALTAAAVTPSSARDGRWAAAGVGFAAGAVTGAALASNYGYGYGYGYGPDYGYAYSPGYDSYAYAPGDAYAYEAAPAYSYGGGSYYTDFRNHPNWGAHFGRYSSEIPAN